MTPVSFTIEIRFFVNVHKKCYTEDEGVVNIMRSDKNTIMNVKNWLDKNDYSQAWLADQMGVAKSLISQIFNGTRKLQTTHIIKISEITGLSIAELASSDQKTCNQLVYSLRGKISNENGQRALDQLLLDSEHFVQLLAK